MCFSQGTSALFSAIGFALTVYTYRRTGNVGLASGVGYFFLMELLQVFQYIWIDDCAHPMNQILTVVGYAHICLQPYFTHVLSMSLVQSRRVLLQFQAVRKLALVAGMLMFVRYLTSGSQLTPPSEACPSHEWLRGDSLCTYKGKYHLAWAMPLADPTYYQTGIAIHSFMMFAPFFLTTKKTMWAQGALLFASGPALAAYITPNLQEQASIWCFFSIAQIAIMLFFISTHMTRERSQKVMAAHAAAYLPLEPKSKKAN
jgi:hypothetical protein